MTPSPSRFSPASVPLGLMDILERFERAWQERPPDIASFLAANAAETVAFPRRQVQEELVKIDLEYRWRAARSKEVQPVPASPSGGLPSRPTIEHYLALHPELAPGGEVSIDLVAEEYRVRWRWGDKPDALSFAQRFPYLADALAARLAQVDDELRREQDAALDGTSPQPAGPPPPTVTPPRVQLTLTQGHFAGFTYTFTERSTCVVGKADDCNLRFPQDKDHQTISRHHCLFDVSPPLVRIRDLGSRNGTYVNGNMIGQRLTVQRVLPSEAGPAREVDLKNGDEVQLGRLGLVVLRVDVEAPLCCSSCGVDISRAASEGSEPAASRPLCERCRQTTTEWEPRGGPRCAGCGADVSGQVSGAAGEFICAECQDRPSQVMERMLQVARGGDDKIEGIKDYEIVRELGRGGMGAVFLARHRQTGEEVALKVMLPKVAVSQRLKRMFLREIENTRLLKHPNVVRVRDLGDSEGAFYFAMDYCAGGSLQNLLRARGQPLALDEAVDIFRKALAGLDYAHNLEVPVALPDGGTGRAVGLVHRDLKPPNLFLSQPTAPWQVRIGDYGLAKAFDAAGLSGLTWTGAACGTPYYMPRVQVVDFRFARPEVDVWAMAACFYFMLTSSPPRDFKPKVDMWRTVLESKPVPLAKRNPAIPPRLAEFVDHALTEEPEIPFKSAAQLRQALEKAL